MSSKVEFGASEVAVRINAVSSGIAEEDLSAIMGCDNPASTIVVPKVDTVQECSWVSFYTKVFSLVTYR